MKKTIQAHDQTISYTVRKNARAKHVRISVSCDGAVFVTQPTRVPAMRIEEIVAKKIDWIVSKINFFKALGLSQRSREEYEHLRHDALSLVRSRIEYFNGFYGFAIGRIAIRNQRTRWGSCSRSGNLNFNYRIVHLSLQLIDYIVVHELCHLKEFNHSQRFWKLVEHTLPHHGELRKALRRICL